MPEKKTKTGKRNKPSAPAKIRAKKIAENIGNGMSLQAAQLAVGHSESYARGGHIKETRAWQEVLDAELNDADLLQNHRQQLVATTPKSISFPAQVSDEDIEKMCVAAGYHVISISQFIGQKFANCLIPDQYTRGPALERAYKLKGKFNKKIADVEDPYKKMSMDEIAQQIKEGRKKFLKL